MEKSNLDRLLQRYLTGQVTEKERKKIEAWLDVMKAEKGNDLKLSESDDEKLFQKITNNIDNIDEIVSFRPENYKPRPFYLHTWFQIAATIFLLVAASFSIIYIKYRSPGVQEFFAINEREKVILNDGTIVWLNTGSKLVYYEKENEVRHAELEGEALFEVAKDPNKPFMIDCGTMTVKVLGTSFNIKTKKNKIELELLTGQVHLSSKNDKTGIHVDPKQKVIYSSNGEVEKLPWIEVEIKDIIATTEYNMQFENTTMDKVLDKIKKKFNADFTIENSQVNNCRITADFTDKSLDKTMSMISELLDIKYEIEKREVTITGNGCH